jgi:hypothetical protein
LAFPKIYPELNLRPLRERRRRGVDDGLRFRKDAGQMIPLTNTLSVDLIDVFVARRTCGKLSTPRNHLQPAGQVLL